ncbi:hypothetical protein D3C76_1075030 [compost metagenome]
MADPLHHLIVAVLKLKNLINLTALFINSGQIFFAKQAQLLLQVQQWTGDFGCQIEGKNQQHNKGNAGEQKRILIAFGDSREQFVIGNHAGEFPADPKCLQPGIQRISSNDVGISVI